MDIRAATRQLDTRTVLNLLHALDLTANRIRYMRLGCWTMPAVNDRTGPAPLHNHRRDEPEPHRPAETITLFHEDEVTDA